MNITPYLNRIYAISRQFGIDPRKTFRAIRNLPRFILDLHTFRTQYHDRISLYPCLHDWHQEAGITKSEYFRQDLLVAQIIYEKHPKRHIDIGSRIDGFVAHVASFRSIEVLDIRPVNTTLPNIRFKQADIMDPNQSVANQYDSISCLHALEHFGLGRYSDPIDPQGFIRALANIAQLLADEGQLYLSVPIGVERVEFNAHRVFSPTTIVSTASKQYLKLQTLIIIDNGEIKYYTASEAPLSDIERMHYVLGIFIFLKDSSQS